MLEERFQVKYLESAIDFLASLDDKTRKKVIYNIDKAKVVLDNKLFKKLTDEIWEFRTLYNKQQVRLLAFWDRTYGEDTLVIATHGFIKKTKKTPQKELDKAVGLMKEYFDQKQTKS